MQTVVCREDEQVLRAARHGDATRPADTRQKSEQLRVVHMAHIVVVQGLRVRLPAGYATRAPGGHLPQSGKLQEH